MIQGIVGFAAGLLVGGVSVAIMCALNSWWKVQVKMTTTASSSEEPATPSPPTPPPPISKVARPHDINNVAFAANIIGSPSVKVHMTSSCPALRNTKHGVIVRDLCAKCGKCGGLHAE